jgi:glucokinase
VVLSTNLPLRDVPLRDLLSERYGVPVVLDNDANVACLAEFRYGAGSGTSEMIMLTLGTGIGGGIVTNGHLYRGASGAAGELGHMLIDYDGPSCQGACPNRGCLEVYASGQAMGQAAGDVARALPDSALGKALAAGDDVDGPLLSAVALAGDPAAVAALSAIGEKLGLGIVSIVNIFNPELVVVGGGAAQAADILLASARRVVAERALRPQRDEVRIVPAQHGVDAGVLGAAALAIIELFPDEAPARGGRG